MSIGITILAVVLIMIGIVIILLELWVVWAMKRKTRQVHYGPIKIRHNISWLCVSLASILLGILLILLH